MGKELAAGRFTMSWQSWYVVHEFLADTSLPRHAVGASRMNMSASGLGPRWHYIIALLLGVAIVACFMAMVEPITYLYRHPDGSHYLEAARNFLAGQGLMVTAGLEKFPLATVPLSLEPPGYPIIVALGSRFFGVDPEWFAPWIVWVSWGLLPSALLFALRPVLRNWSIHVISVLVMIAPGVIENAWQPLTDILFLLVTILSFGLLFRGSWARANPYLLILSGVLGGLAYALRNVGLALFVSIAAGYVALILLNLLHPNIAMRRILWWGAGAAIVLIPLEIRNLNVFGTFQPYQMAPSQLGLLVNIRYYLLESLTDITALHGLTDAFLWNGKFFFATGAVVLILAAVNRKLLLRLWTELPAGRKEVLIIFIANILAGSAIVILARSRYQWNEVINQRQILQYDWLLLAVCALLLEQAAPLSKKALAAISISVMVLAGLRMTYAWQEIEMDRQEYAVAQNASDLVTGARTIPSSSALAMKLVIARDQDLIRAVKDLPADTILVSNYDDVLRVKTGRVVHNIHPEDDCKAITRFRDQISTPEVAMLIFPFGTILQSGCWKRLEQSQQSRLNLSATRPYLISLGGSRAGTDRLPVSP